MIKVTDAEAKLVAATVTARGALLPLATRFVAANLMLMGIQYSALKELADKCALILRHSDFICTIAQLLLLADHTRKITFTDPHVQQHTRLNACPSRCKPSTIPH
jgi:hypothetical protein